MASSKCFNKQNALKVANFHFHFRQTNTFNILITAFQSMIFIAIWFWKLASVKHFSLAFLSCLVNCVKYINTVHILAWISLRQNSVSFVLKFLECDLDFAVFFLFATMKKRNIEPWMKNEYSLYFVVLLTVCVHH